MEKEKMLNEIPDDALKAVNGGYAGLTRGSYVSVEDSSGYWRWGKIVCLGTQTEGGITRQCYYVEFNDGRSPKVAQVFPYQIVRVWDR